MTSISNIKKKLIEVAIPLEAINAASAREKSIRHGHPSTLHLWWARRPLAACRAVLFAQLVDDPSSHPDKFPTEEAIEAERQRLFRIIEELVIWENSTNDEVLERARVEIRKSCGDKLPVIYDPFSGGASIPLEAQRLGLPSFGSDLNPVAVMIGKAMVEIPPRFKDKPPIHPGARDRNHYRNAEGLAEDIKYYGEWMREQAFTRIGHLYPQVDLPKELGGRKATVVAWIWARTVPSPDPAFADTRVPLASSFLLSLGAGKEAWIDPIVDKSAKSIAYKVRSGGTKEQLEKAKKGTKAGRAVFNCIFSGTPITGDYIDKQASQGKMGKTLLAVIAEGVGGRRYLSVDALSEQAATVAAEAAVSEMDLSYLEIPCRGTFASNAQGRRYGFKTFKDYFIERQLVALNTFSELVREVRSKVEEDALAAGLSSKEGPLRDGGDGARAYAEAVSVYLAFAIDRVADAGSSVATWSSSGFIRFTFARQGIAMTWDFAECNVFSDSTGNFLGAVEWVWKALLGLSSNAAGKIVQHDAQTVKIPENSVISTDPPYYDNIGYADLSDYFYVWLRWNIKDVFPAQSSTITVPKAEELVATPYRHGGNDEAEKFFLDGMTAAISSLSLQASSEFPATIYYAFKQSEVDQDGLSSTGWATFIQAVISAGYSIVGTWPVRTERAARTIASGTNALANSVVLVCRKKEMTAEVITRAEFIRAMKREVPPAIAELQAANIAPADMPQSAIGPGMGVFSRYKAVLESDDRPMSVKTALQLINRELDEYLGGIQGEFDADTRFAITWFEQNGLKAGDYGTANNIATARGISVESVKHARIVESAAGKVRIFSRDELDEDWEPESDGHLTVWECLQHLVRQHEKDGISHDTAVLLKKIAAKAEAVKDLAYCLYDISANKRKDAKEATAYNALIADWTELSRQAAAIHDTSGDRQIRLDI
jgi:putative DNA methylase